MSFPADIAAANAGIDPGDFNLNRVCIRPMPSLATRLLGSNVAAITIGDSILVSEDLFQAVIDGDMTTLLRHELVHVAQWRDERALPFLWHYLGDYARNRLIGLDHAMAYRAIGHEAFAYQVSESFVESAT